MEYVHNPMTGTVKYVTHTWAKWLKSYGWRTATFEQFMAWQCAQYNLYPANDNNKNHNVILLNDRL